MKSLPNCLFLGSLLVLASASFGACDDSSNANDTGGDGDGDGGSHGDGDGNGGGGSSGDGDGDNTPSESYCESDKTCRPFDQVCDPARRVCVDCLEKADCTENEVCDAGACLKITPCTSSKGCPPDQVCAVDSVGYCVECDGDNDCEAEQTCSGFKCYDKCTSDKECRETDGVCDTEVGLCLACVTDKDCDDSELCAVGGTCAPRVCTKEESFCSGDALTSCNARGDGFITTTCPEGCNASEGICESPEECETGDKMCECYPNDTCNGELSCESGICVEESGGGTGGSGNGGDGDYCLSIPAFTGTQTVDGAPTEFAGIAPMVFDFASSDYQAIAPTANDPTTTTTQAEVRVAWDSTALRIHIHVDDALVAHGPGANYDGDNVQIFVSSLAPSTGVQYSDYATQITIVPAVTLPTASVASYSEYVSGYTGAEPDWITRTVSGGYEVEVEWPWRAFVPTAGSQISLNFQIGVANTSNGARDYEYALHLDSTRLSSNCGSPEAPWCDTRHWCTPVLK